MARISTGPKVKQRSQQIFAALLTYANNELDETKSLEALPLSAIAIKWQTDTHLIVKTKLRHLKVLTAVVDPEHPLTTAQIREALNRWGDWLGILQDHRTTAQGSEVWHFSLHLWNPRQDMTANLQRYGNEWDNRRQGYSSLQTFTSTHAPNSDSLHRQDWEEELDVSFFYGRTEELEILSDWALPEGCKLVTILGLGGIGKSTIAMKFAKHIQDEFEVVCWRSLRNAPPLETLLQELIPFLSNQQDHEVTPKRLLHWCQVTRCLLIFDNVETILQAGDLAGQYRPGYENYGEFFQMLGISTHQSFILLTSREKPADIATLEGEGLSVRSLLLQGSLEASMSIINAKGIRGSIVQKQSLCHHYSCSPLAIKIVASSIQDLFDGDITQFLAEGTFFFNGVRRLLKEQFDRLSDLEQSIMYWLAINRDWTTIAVLETDLFPKVSKSALLESLESLSWRSLIERRAGRYTQQSVVMEYVTSRFIEGIEREISDQQLSLFANHALLTTTAKDFIQQSQIRLIIQPLLHQLFPEDISNTAAQIMSALLQQVKETPSLGEGYAAGNLINLCHYGNIELTGYDFSNLKIRQADLQDITLHQVNFSDANLSTSVFSELLGDIMAIQFSPDGRLIATGDSNGVLCLWDVTTGQRVQTFRGHAGWILSLAFSSNGKLLATSSNDQAVRIWDVDTGDCLHILTEHTNVIWSVDFSPDDVMLASGSNDGRIKIWHVESGRCIKTFLASSDHGLYSVVFHPSNRAIAAGGDDPLIRIWDLRSEQVIQSFTGHTDVIRVLAFSPDGNLLASGGHDQSLRLWEVDSGSQKAVLEGHRFFVWTVAFHPSQPFLGSGGLDGLLKVWNIQTMTCERSLQAHSTDLYSLTFSPSGDVLVSGGSDHTVKFWQLESGQLLKTIQGHQLQEHQVRSLDISPDGTKLASSSDAHVIYIWNLETNYARQSLQGHQDWVFAVRFSPNGNHLASAGRDQLVKVWDAQSGETLCIFEGHQGWVFDVDFCPSSDHDNGSELLASAGIDGAIKLWDLDGQCCAATINGHVNSVWSIAFSPNGHQLASGGQDHLVKIWDVQSRQLLATYREHTNQVQSVIFSPREKMLASGSQDGTIRLWDIDSHQPISILSGEGMGQVWDIAFSPDGKLIASGSVDCDIRLWDVNKGKLLRTLQGHQGWILSVDFQPNGTTLMSGSADGSIKIWDVETGRCLKTLRRDRPYEGMNITGIRGVTEAQISTLIALGACRQNH